MQLRREWEMDRMKWYEGKEVKRGERTRRNVLSDLVVSVMKGRGSFGFSTE
jgi:hypothetical protein